MNEKIHWHVIAPTTWPSPPAEMSVSTCVEIEECPRRWALSNAEYPELWSGRGYPPKLQVPALAGSVVHLALEIIMKQFNKAGVPSITDSSAPQVMRELGGYTRVVEECIERILKPHIGNPRAGVLMEHARRVLYGQVPTLRARVQSILSRLRLPQNAPSTPAASVPKSAGPPPRVPLVKGIHPEVEVRAKSIGWKGKVDLLVLGDKDCEINDFKTGATDEAHKFQVRTYAVIWRLDEELNPSGLLANRLILTYETQDIEVPSPSVSEIDNLSRELLSRRKTAGTALTMHPPPARPSSETCRYCSVRQLCDAYWASATQVVSNDGRFGDIELMITRRHGPTSWDAVVVQARDIPTKAPVLLRFHQHYDFKEGTRVRVIDGAFARASENDDAPAIVTIGILSEAYCEPPGHQNMR